MTVLRTAFAGVLAAAVALAAGNTGAHLRGHGGPVRALAVSADGRTAVSGGFDQSAILWDIDTEAARTVLRVHDGAVNAVTFLPNGGFATAGEDGRIALFASGGTAPSRVFAAHEAPIVGLAVSPDGKEIASAAWDGTVRVQPLAGGEPRVLQGHQGNVNAVAYLPDRRLVSAGYDATVRIWPAEDGAPVVVTLPPPVNALAVLPGDRIAAAGSDGAVRIVGADGIVVAVVETGASPATGLASSPDGSQLAVATIAGDIVMIDCAAGKIVPRIAGTGVPVWVVAFRPDGRELLSGDGDRLVRRYDAATGEPIGAPAPAAAAERRGAPASDRGAELFRACSACHTLSASAENRAGPSLHGVFGRRIATLPGYNFSEALKRLDVVWDAETIGRLFEIGPSRYTPGTKMPEQIIASPADREALTRFLDQATR